MKSNNTNQTTAYLSNDGSYTSFTFRNKRITFLTSKILERYTQVLKWDHGYLEVLCLKRGRGEEEEYIDLLPILENLYIDAETFLKPITEVKIENAGRKEV